MSARLGMPSGSRMHMSIDRNGLNAIRREPPRFQLHHNNPLDLQHHELYGRRVNPLKVQLCYYVIDFKFKYPLLLLANYGFCAAK